MSRTPPCWPFLPCRLFGMTWRSFPVLFSLFFNPSARSVLVFHLCVFCPDLRSMAPEVWENFRHTHWVVQSSGRRKRVQPALSQETINYTLTPSLFLPPSHFLSPPPWTKEKKKNTSPIPKHSDEGQNSRSPNKKAAQSLSPLSQRTAFSQKDKWEENKTQLSFRQG